MPRFSRRLSSTAFAAALLGAPLAPQAQESAVAPDYRSVPSPPPPPVPAQAAPVDALWFPENKATLDANAQALVARIASAWPAVALERLTITGHADASETSPANAQALSERRAAAVKAAFVANGVDPARIRVAGQGARHPLGDDRTAAGRDRNRRVEIEVSLRESATAFDRR